jgi:hypothetical protein
VLVGINVFLIVFSHIWVLGGFIGLHREGFRGFLGDGHSVS